jgi:hypothetical protein
MMVHADASAIYAGSAECGPFCPSGSSSHTFGIRWSDALEERMRQVAELRHGASFAELRSLIHDRPSLTDPSQKRERRVWLDRIKLMAMAHDAMHDTDLGALYVAGGVPQAYRDRVELEWQVPQYGREGEPVKEMRSMQQGSAAVASQRYPRAAEQDRSRAMHHTGSVQEAGSPYSVRVDARDNTASDIADQLSIAIAQSFPHLVVSRGEEGLQGVVPHPSVYIKAPAPRPTPQHRRRRKP